MAPGSGCEEAVCHLVLRLDATTLDVLGYSVQGGPLNEVDATQALRIAQDQIDANVGFGVVATLDNADGGLYAASGSLGDYGGFALVGVASGLVLTAGAINWESGYYWFPTGWMPASDIELGDATVSPQGPIGETGSCEGVAPANEARNVALRSNAALHFARKGSFSLFTYLFQFARRCSAESAEMSEYLVVLTQVK
jgi:hypothetical protein